MTDLYSAFEPPPPLPPTAFSWPDPDGTRARFPNFLADPDPAKACRDFMHKIIQPHMSEAFIIQYLTAGALLLGVACIALGIVIVRVSKKQFWLFRFWRQPAGLFFTFNSTKLVNIELKTVAPSYLASSPHSIFCAMCSIFALLFVGIIGEEVVTYGYNHIFQYGAPYYYLCG